MTALPQARWRGSAAGSKGEKRSVTDRGSVDEDRQSKQEDLVPEVFGYTGTLIRSN